MLNMVNMVNSGKYVKFITQQSPMVNNGKYSSTMGCI